MKQRIWLWIAAAAAAVLLAIVLLLPGEKMQQIPEAAFGMVLIDIADEYAADSYHVDTQGVYVLVVEEKSPAFAAGVQSGDRIVSMNGVPVINSPEFVALQEKLTPRQKVDIRFQRGNGGPYITAQLEWNGQAE